VHAGVGRLAFVWASLVALSTLYTKQHYVADVLGGIAVAWLGYALFLRRFPREATPEHERSLAPRLAAAAFGSYAAILLVFVTLWLLSAERG
jgi:membrane-associated phospholipid phosphatase